MDKLSISTKIKLLGLLLFLTMSFVISVTIFLNQKNEKDATIVNLAGKQRMLTQMITKNIFLLNKTSIKEFTQIDHAVESFNFGLNTLKNGNASLQIASVPSGEIANQIHHVEILWNQFSKNVELYKKSILNDDKTMQTNLFNYFKMNNNNLLHEVDLIVNLYTQFIESKTSFIQKFQYLAFTLLFIFTIYAVIQLKQIEEHAREFIKKYRDLTSADLNSIQPIDVNIEKEFVEVAGDMNCFIERVNSAMEYSNSALEQSKLASQRLEELTSEFGMVITDLENKSDILKHLDSSEDIAIESSENLLRTTKKLNDLKEQLDHLLSSCTQHKN